MTWAIVADSSCNLRSFEPTAPDTVYRFAPLKINVAGREYIDNADLDVEDLNRRVAAEGAASSSSCPSAGEWAELFRCAENVIAVTISSNLSGSYEAACIARDLVLEEGGHRIYVLDTRSAGGKLEVIVEMLDRYLHDGERTFEDACDYARSLERSSQVLFSLMSYENLSKSGRMPKMAGIIASKLSIRILGTASPEGTIKIVGPAHGERKMNQKTVNTMAADGYRGGLVYIDYVDGQRAAHELADMIVQRWPTAQIRILPCGALCSFYAERGGLIIGYEWFTTR
ncbi:degV family protein [Coriobacterium glomerans PW2]|uniref:DegV family protein n=1 Tax=Coriobacterium glomerans (strain ATCC 49209 / DSM 20642 / JCM 10262 / PW2) TaxID=700015 RepID=F2N7W4_CORGP|nr:DegV family protein [Coriobacterium glomerans]AEB07073.1 degV family protein [Coriobacterium glomerans PW2]